LRRWGRHETDRFVGLWDEEMLILIGVAQLVQNQ
jgi:hypothetical protein